MPVYDPLNNPTPAPQYSGPVIITEPLHDVGVADHYFARQRYGVSAESYQAPTLNDTRTINSITFYNVGDTTPTLDEAGFVFYERQWSTIPASWYDYSTESVTFPGIAYGSISERRYAFTKEVAVQIQNEYFLVGTGGSYASADLIPVVAATSFQYPSDTAPRDPSDIFLTTSSTPTADGWSTAVTTGDYTYIVRPSTIERYAGNIWVRKTFRVRPL